MQITRNYNINPYFTGYKSSKYNLVYSSNSLLDTSSNCCGKLNEQDRIFLDSINPTPEERPYMETMLLHNPSSKGNLIKYKSGKIKQGVLFARNTKEEIKKLFKFFIPNKSTKAYIKSVYDKLQEGSVESSNYEMILDLVYDKKLSPTVLLHANKRGRLSKNAEKDLDMLYMAYSEQKDPKDVFVLEFKDKKEAKDLDVGDVCHFEGDKNISIKQKDGGFKELFISKETYLELFPPFERYAYNQANQGDCYLIAAIDSIYQNKNTRHKILEMFRENEDGTVDAAYGGFKKEEGQIVPNIKDAFILHDIETKILNAPFNYSAFTSEGLRALEILNEETGAYYGGLNVQRHYELCTLLLDEMNNDDSIYYNNFRYTKDELQDFIKLYEDKNAVIISSKDKDLMTLCVQKEDVDYALSELQKQKVSNFNSTYERHILERYKEFLERTGEEYVVFEEVLPFELYANIFGNEISPNCPSVYNQSGSPETIFQKMGFDTFVLEINSNEAKRLLNSKDISENFLLTCTSHQPKRNNLDIIPNHSYSFSAIDTKDGRRFAIRNPKNTMNEILLTYEEFVKYFTLINAAEIN